ncbi:serine/threonine-protein kinase ICK isoform X1 [Vespula squamosa]|uniref:Serine/threonine-protein kinase ICK isoform X1 n=1 Tax=Vespula squamosa TaxID=30214 RepID=A0ABD2A1F3_VESSQ
MNWSLPVWNETMQLKNWNQQSQSATKNARKVSAKQHYLSVARNGDTDSNRSRLTMNGMIGPPTSEKYEEYNDNFWGPRENVENQTRQHYLSRNRFIAEPNSRMPYPNVYGTHNIKQPNKSALQTNLFGSVLNVRGSGGGLHGRTDWAAKYLK